MTELKLRGTPLPGVSPVEQRFTRARWATMTLFFANGVVLASWASRVPAVQQHLNLTAGQLGFALLGVAIGGLPAMSLAALLIARYDHRRVACVSALLLCLALPLPTLAINGPSLFIALLILGAASGALNVAQNSQGAVLEGHFPRPIMASFHAFFSLGGLVGSLIGAEMASVGLSPLLHLTIVMVVLLIAVLRASVFLLPVTTAVSSEARPPLRDILRPLLPLGTIAFSTVLVEGAVTDWSAVYLHKSVGASSGVAALGYAAFATTMVLGRTIGDRLSERLGDRTLIRYGALLGTIGLGTALLIGGIPATLVGFACVGIGCACVFPTLMRASARLEHVAPSAAIAAISTAGFMGFFLGPPLIGLIADHVALHLRGAMTVLVAGDFLIVLLASNLAPNARAVTSRTPVVDTAR